MRPIRRSLTAPVLCALPAVLMFGSPAAAQIVNPADKQSAAADSGQATGGTGEPRRLRTWELPPTVVEAEHLSKLREEDRIGDYGQPRWTATRRFPTTRVYVIPEGKVEFEYWTRIKTPRHGETTVQTQYELEIGLPNRFMLDLYWVGEKTGERGSQEYAEQKVELRYALADWGKIWGNPTIYEEYVSVGDGDDVVESKLLLGDELAEGWHWGTNFVWERELGGARTNVYELTGGLSHTLSDEKFSLGGEFKFELEDVRDDRGDFTDTFEIGPSLQYRPFPGLHLDVAPLFGIGPDSRRSDVYIVLGYEF